MLLLALLVACSVSEEAFPDALANAACRRLEQCEADAFDDVWDDREDCEEAWADLAEAYLDLGDLLGQTYDPAAGGQCVREVRHADCDQVESGDIDCEIWE